MRVLLVSVFLFISTSLFTQDSISLYLFLLDDCPICLEYTPTINKLHDTYGEQITFIGYFPNISSKPAKIDSFQKKYKINFDLKTDYYKTQSKKWNAEVTPEVILYNHTKGKILYQGRIDNKFVKLGRRRGVVTEHDLQNAISSTLNGEKIIVSKTDPVGCYINYNDKFGR